jgi:hypothetical protein
MSLGGAEDLVRYLYVFCCELGQNMNPVWVALTGREATRILRDTNSPRAIRAPLFSAACHVRGRALVVDSSEVSRVPVGGAGGRGGGWREGSARTGSGERIRWTSECGVVQV